MISPLVAGGPRASRRARRSPRGDESDGASPWGRARRSPAVWPILALGAALRLATLDRQSFWLDEAFSYWMANRPLGALLAELPGSDSHPPLHYLVLNLMLRAGGAEWWLRLPSALAGIASIGLLYLLGQEIFDRHTGLLASLILAVSPLHIWYAQEARMYALVACFALAAGLFAIRALKTGATVAWVLLGISEGLALWTNTGALWFALAMNGFALLAAPTLWRARRFWPWVGAQLLALLVYAPWVPAFLQQLRGGFASWIPPATIAGLARTVADFAGSYERPTLEAGLAMLALATIAGLWGRGLRADLASRRTPVLLLGCWLAIPVGLAFLISQPYAHLPLVSNLIGPGRSVFLTRNLIAASFPLYIFMARGLLAGRRPALIGGVTVLVLLGGLAYVGNTIVERKEDYRGAAAVVAARQEPGDAILCSPAYLELPFAYYRPGRSATGIALDSLTDGVVAGDTLAGDSPSRVLQRARRVWLISNDDNVFRQDDSGIREALDNQGGLVEAWRLRGVTVRLYTIHR